jgi:L-threonylcarbamoyladenylate synthase
VKGRALDKGIPVLLADLDDLSRVVGAVPALARTLMERFWPGSLTLIVPRHPALPGEIAPADTVAVRIPDHPTARALIRAAGGAVATTSANLSGEPPAQDAQEALAALRGLVAAVLDGGAAPGKQASTIVDCSGPELRIVRPGPLSAAALLDQAE